MTWSNPVAWTLLALAIPIVVLHLRFRRRRDATVSSLVVWRELGVAGTGRRGFRLVEDAVQLACLLAALVAFTAALAGPVTGAPPAPSRRLAIVLDVSATMNARDGERTRFDTARDAALVAIGRLGPDDDVVVWTASERPRVAVEPTRDRDAARAAVAAIRPTLEAGGLATSVDLARAALGPGAGTLVAFTDTVGAAQYASSATTSAADALGVVLALDRTTGNSGFADVRFDAADARLHLRVRRTDGPAVARTAVLTRGDAEVARAEVPGGDDVECVLPLDAFADGGAGEVRLEPADDFAPDDRVAFVLPSPRPLRVVVTADGRPPSPFLVGALRSMPELVDADAAVLAGVEAPADAFAGADVLVVEGRVPAAAPRDRPMLVFAAPGTEVASPTLWSVGAHVVLEGADLAPLRLDRANVLVPERHERAIVECAEGVVAVAGEPDGLRRIRFGFRPDATTLPLEAAFPVLVRNSLRWLTRPQGLPPAVRAGAPIVTAQPLAVGDRVWIEGPGDLPPRPVRVEDGFLAEAAPLPGPVGPRTLRIRGLRGPSETAVNWFPPPGFRVHGSAAPAAGSLWPDAATVAASLPDRTRNVDTRTPWSMPCAVAGAVALVAGALLLPRRRRAVGMAA